MTERYKIPNRALLEDAYNEGIQKFSVAAGVSRNGKLLLVRRVADDFLGGLYELPGGGIDEGETLKDALYREIQEELGLKIRSIFGLFNGFDYEDANGDKTRQFNIAVEVKSGEIILNKSEHDKSIWVNKEELEKLPLTSEIRDSATSFFDLFMSNPV